MIIVDQRGPQENIDIWQTGLIVPGLDLEALHNVDRELAENPELLAKMEDRSRDYALQRSVEEVFVRSWEMYEDGG